MYTRCKSGFCIVFVSNMAGFCDGHFYNEISHSHLRLLVSYVESAGNVTCCEVISFVMFLIKNMFLHH